MDLEKHCTIERIRILAEEKNRLSEKILRMLPNENMELKNAHYDLISAIDGLILKEAKFLAKFQ